VKILHKSILLPETRSCHAASIAIYNDDYVVSWFGGSYEGKDDVALYLYHQNKLKKLKKEYSTPYWNPVLFTLDDNLMMFYKVGLFCDRWQTYIKTFDNMCNETQDIILPAGLNGAVKTQPIRVGNELYCGSSVETFWDWTSYIECYNINNNKLSFSNRTLPITIEKKEYTAQLYSGPVTRKSLGIIQPALIQDDKERIHAFYRSSHGINKICYSNINRFDTNIKVQELDIDNPNSGIDAKYIAKDDEIILFYNPSKTLRHPLVASRYKYEAKNGNIALYEQETLVIEDHVPDNLDTLTSELSYPFATLYDNKFIHLVYTIGRSFVGYVILEI